MHNIFRGYSTSIIHVDRDSKIKTNIRIRLLAIYLFFAPLDFLPIIPGISFSKLLIFIPLIGCFLALKYVKIRFDKFFGIPIIYVMVLFLTMFYSYDASFTKQRIITIGLNIAVILIISMFNYSDTEIRIIKNSMVYSGWFTLLLIMLYSDTSLMGGRMTVEINGAYQDPNYLVGFLIFTIINYLEGFMEKRSIKEFIMFCIFVIVTFLTGSRGGLLAVLGAILFYISIWMKSKGFKFSSVIKLVIFIILLAIILNISLEMLPTTLAQRFDVSYTLGDGGANRLELFESALNAYKTFSGFNKLFGQGAGTIRYFTYSGHVAHNIWIESLIEIGIVGTSILFMFYFLYFKKAWRIKEYVAAASFVGYIIMTLSMSLYSYKPIWNIILLIMIIKNSDETIKNNSSKNSIVEVKQ